MFIKICGITNIKDAMMAIEAGATALGFNFYPKSKRYISAPLAAKICRELPSEIIKVGLFVNATEDYINQIDTACNLDLIQFHGDEAPSFCAKWSPRVIRALRLQSADDLVLLEQYQFAKMIILDAAVKGAYGGTGKLSNWTLASQAKAYGLPIILAGGLNPENVKQAIKAVLPYGVDVAGGVESSPGHKSLDKTVAFIQAAICC